MRVRLSLGTLVTALGAGAVGLVGWHAYTDHSASQGLRDTLAQLGLSGLIPTATAANPSGVTTSQAVGNNQPSGNRCPGGALDESSFLAANPQFTALRQAWQQGQWSVVAPSLLSPPSGPNDWSAFRMYVQRLGYQDPGSLPSIEMCR